MWRGEADESALCVVRTTLLYSLCVVGSPTFSPGLAALLASVYVRMPPDGVDDALFGGGHGSSHICATVTIMIAAYLPWLVQARLSTSGGLGQGRGLYQTPDLDPYFCARRKLVAAACGLWQVRLCKYW